MYSFICDKGHGIMKKLDQTKIQQLKEAFLRAIDLAGNVHRLHLKTQVSEASLNRYRSGRQDIVPDRFLLTNLKSAFMWPI